MVKPIIIIGAGGHAKVLADAVIKSGEKLLGFLDDTVTGEVIGGYSVLGIVADCERYADQARFVIGIGNNAVRRCIAEQYALEWATVIHPSAQIGLCVALAEGTVVLANAVINSHATVGRHSIINAAALVDHDAVVGDFVHLSSHATLCGAAKVGENAVIGAGAVVPRLMTVQEGVVIADGSVYMCE